MKNKFFLISFLPAIAYWILDAYYPVRIAVAGGLILAVLEIILEKIFSKKVHTLSKFNFFLILVLGGLSFLGEDGVWFKLSPCFTGLGVGAFLLFENRKGPGHGLLYGMLSEMQDLSKIPLPIPVYQQIFFSMEMHFAFFFIGYSLLMGSVALWGTSNQWIFFKTAGQYLSFGIFGLGEMILMRWKIKRYFHQKQQLEFLKRF
jgi:intracellular septation protein